MVESVPVNLRSLQAVLLISAASSSLAAGTIQPTITRPSGVGDDRCMVGSGWAGTSRPLSHLNLDEDDFRITALAEREDETNPNGARLDSGRFNPPSPPHDIKKEEPA